MPYSNLSLYKLYVSYIHCHVKNKTTCTKYKHSCIKSETIGLYIGSK